MPLATSEVAARINFCSDPYLVNDRERGHIAQPQTPTGKLNNNKMKELVGDYNASNIEVTAKTL